MRINWRVTAGMLIAFGAVLGILLGISLIRASGGNGAAEFEVTVRFNTSVTQDDLDEAGALLRTFDDDVEFLIMEIFPPVGHAVLVTDGYVGRPRDASDFCQTVQAELEAKRFVDSVSCQPWQEPDQAEPDTPVSTNNDPNP